MGALEFARRKIREIVIENRYSDEIKETGYIGTNWEDWGYMPHHPAR